jgi:hypothetical protein
LIFLQSRLSLDEGWAHGRAKQAWISKRGGLSNRVIAKIKVENGHRLCRLDPERAHKNLSLPFGKIGDKGNRPFFVRARIGALAFKNGFLPGLTLI